MSERILVVGPSWVGDMVMAQSLFMTLKNRFPDCVIDVLAPAWSIPVIARMPEVRRGVCLDIAHKSMGLMLRIKLARKLVSEKYTRAIILPRSWKSALVPWLAKIPLRTGYRGEMRYGLINDMRELDKTLLTRTVHRFVALGQEMDQMQKMSHEYETPFPVLNVNRDNAQQVISRLELNLEKPVIGFMPGAEYGPAKCWPVEYFGELASKLVTDGYQVWVFGSQRDVTAGDRISEVGGGDVLSLCGITSLEEVIDLISVTNAVVTNDSGLMHIASAANVPVHVIYGSSTPDYTPPLSDSAEVYYKNLSCSPCFDRTCRFGHYNCLKNIQVDEVLNKIKNDSCNGKIIK